MLNLIFTDKNVCTHKLVVVFTIRRNLATDDGKYEKSDNVIKSLSADFKTFRMNKCKAFALMFNKFSQNIIQYPAISVIFDFNIRIKAALYFKFYLRFIFFHCNNFKFL